MHIFHNWGKWKQIKEGVLQKRLIQTGLEVEYGNYMDQQRECLDCGKKEWDRQKVSVN